jgi:CDP-paratose synthetase
MILLTGATGFLGSKILKRLISDQEEVVVLKRSFSNSSRIDDLLTSCKYYNIDEEPIEAIFNKHKIETIIHTATCYGRRNETIDEIYLSNYYFPFKLATIAERVGVARFINTDTSLSKNVNHYSFSKKQFSEALIFLRSKMKVVNIELQYIYGPGDEKWKFLSMLVNKLANSEPYIEFTSALKKRDFIHIDDVVSAYLLLLNTENIDVSKFEIGSGKAKSLQSIINLTKELTGNTSTELRFGVLPDRISEPDIMQADTSSLLSLGWHPTISLEKGIKELITSIKL